MRRIDKLTCLLEFVKFNNDNDTLFDELLNEKFVLEFIGL